MRHSKFLSSDVTIHYLVNVSRDELQSDLFYSNMSDYENQIWHWPLLPQLVLRGSEDGASL